MKRLIKAARTVFLPTKHPIDDPLREKEILEKRGSAAYIQYLADKKGVTEVALLHEALEARIAEVYRLCYEASKDIKVIEKFAGFFPGLAFNSPWLAVLVKQQTAFPRADPGSDRNRLLRALANGLGKAASPLPRMRRWNRANRLAVAKIVQKQMQREFSERLCPSGWKEATEEHKEELVSREIERLVRTYRILEPCSDALRSHLRNGRARKASLLIAHKLFGFPVRALESKPAI